MQVMNFTWSAWLLLILAMTGHSHQLSISPTCAPSDPCTTLTQYALGNTHSDSTRLVLQPGRHKLTTDLTVQNVSDFSIVAATSSNPPVVIDCQQTAAIRFKNVSSLVIKYVEFVSCGKTTPQTTPGVTMLGVRGLTMWNITLSGSVNGALYVDNSTDLNFHNLTVTNNYDSTSSIIHFIQCDANISGTTTITNNRISFEITGPEAMILIENCDLNFESLIVSDNDSPKGVISIHNHSVMAEGDWTFEHNQVCENGSLFLDSTSTSIRGNIFFKYNTYCICNKIVRRNPHTHDDNVTGARIINSHISIVGNIDLYANKGCPASLHISSSTITVTGSVNIQENTVGQRVVHLDKDTTLVITDTLYASKNSLTKEIINVISGSRLSVERKVDIVQNGISVPIVVFNGIIKLSGMINFTSNAGVLFAFQSDVYINEVSHFINNSVSDDYFDGTLALDHSTLVLSGHYTFESNQVPKKKGGAIYATRNCDLTLAGIGKFINNSAEFGGAIYLDQRSLLTLKPGTHLNFTNNTAIKGGAIFIQAPYTLINCTSPSCFFNLDDDKTASDISLSFTGNVANPGGSVLHVNMDGINYTTQNLPLPALDNLKKTFRFPDDTNTKPMYHSDNYLFCFCTNNSESKCDSSRTKHLPVVQGRQTNITVKALIVFGDFAKQEIKGKEDYTDEPIAYISLTVLLSSYGKNVSNNFALNSTDCRNVTFSVNSNHESEVLTLNIGESLIDEDKTLCVNVTFDPCPMGFSFSTSEKMCECDYNIQEYISNCDINDETFQKNTDSLHFWMGAYNNTSSYLYYERCPRGYCITDGKFTFNDDARICTQNRTGQLCGKCVNGSSLLLGGVKCDDCTNKNTHLALLIAFAVLGVLLVVFIFLTQMTVTVGTINGLILYMNVIDANRSIFFASDFFKSYNIIYVISLSWLNLDFGFETCFYDGLDQTQYAAWQFVFPVYLWLMVGVIIVVCHYSMKVSMFFGSSHPVAVLATVILLTYNSLVQNIIGIFSVAHLTLVSSDNVFNASNTSKMAVWLYNGEIPYAKGHHIWLIVLAIVFFVFLYAPFTLVLTFAQLLQKFDFTSKILQRLRLIPFINAFQVPFKPAHRYWVGLCLMMRTVVIAATAAAENEEVILVLIITFCVVSLTMLAVTKGVYENYWLNVLEVSFILNLAVLSAARLYSVRSSTIIIAAYVSMSIAFATFVGIVGFHVCLQLKKMNKIKRVFAVLKSKFKKKKQKKETQEKNSSSPPIEVQNITQSCCVDLREPLLESQLMDSQQS